MSYCVKLAKAEYGLRKTVEAIVEKIRDLASLARGRILQLHVNKLLKNCDKLPRIAYYAAHEILDALVEMEICWPNHNRHARKYLCDVEKLRTIESEKLFEFFK